MAELEIEQNLSHEFDALTEAGAHLQPLAGPGCVQGRGAGVAWRARQGRAGGPPPVGRRSLVRCRQPGSVPIWRAPPAPCLLPQAGGPAQPGQLVLHEQRAAGEALRGGELRLQGEARAGAGRVLEPQAAPGAPSGSAGVTAVKPSEASTPYLQHHASAPPTPAGAVGGARAARALRRPRRRAVPLRAARARRRLCGPVCKGGRVGAEGRRADMQVGCPGTCCADRGLPGAGASVTVAPAASRQVGVALLSGKTDAPAAVQGVAEEMSYEREVVTTEGGLEAETHVRAARLRCSSLPASAGRVEAALACGRSRRPLPRAAAASSHAAAPPLPPPADPAAGPRHRRHQRGAPDAARTGGQGSPRVLVHPPAGVCVCVCVVVGAGGCGGAG